MMTKMEFKFCCKHKLFLFFVFNKIECTFPNEEQQEIELNSYQEKRISNFRILKNPSKYFINVTHDLHKNFKIILNYYGRASFHLLVPKEWETHGLCGNNNEDKNDDLCSRDEKCLTVESVTNEKIHEIFGLSWKTPESELLFQNWMKVTGKFSILLTAFCIFLV